MPSIRIGAAARPLRSLSARTLFLLLPVLVACGRDSLAPRAASRLTTVTSASPQSVELRLVRMIEADDSLADRPTGVAAWSLAGVADPINVTFDAKRQRVWILDALAQELVEQPAEAIRTGGAPIRRIDVRGIGLKAPEGLTVDGTSGALLVLDAGPRIVRIQPHPVLGVDKLSVSTIDLSAAGLSHPRGVALDPATGDVHVLDPDRKTLREFAPTGEPVATRDVSAFALDQPRGMTFAPSGDATDDPDATSLYVGTSAGVTELSLARSVAPVAATATAVLVRTTLTSQYSPPSPDPSGVTYAAHLDKLLIFDSEVDEMGIYKGANVFETTTAGALTRTWNTLSFSREPTGSAYNATDHHIFISDDDQRRVIEVAPGADDRYGTSDDRVTYFDTRAFGSGDPEGIAYDPSQHALYIIDGVNAEVYRITPGNNGVFDGAPPAGDDQGSHWDTAVHGLTDPEGVVYAPDVGHLFAVGKPNTLLFEFTTAGALVRTIDISAAHADKPAGLGYGPTSNNPSGKSIFIVDRGVDNNSQSSENDGKMYEFSLAAAGNTLPDVTITAPASGETFTQGSAVTFTGTAADAEDGNLTARLTWSSSLDGSLGSGGTITTSALSPGTHTIIASVTDNGGAQNSATITVTVNAPGTGTAVQVRVAASTDDAEENASGTVSLTSSDLELVYDGSNQTVGMRFTSVPIPVGASITRAWVQFQVDETSSEATSLTIRGEAADNPVTFSGTNKVSTRPRTTSAVAWAPVAWTVVNQAGAAQQTPNLAAVIQEIVSRSGWRSGNALAIIVTGTGKRTAEAYDGTTTGAPLLHVEYTIGPPPPNSAPVASNVAISGTPQVGRTLTGSYVYTDAEADAEGASTYRWLRDGSPIGGAITRSYTLVGADEGTLIRLEVTPVAATGASPGTAVQSADVGPVTPAPVNSVPAATSLTIAGTAQVGQTLTGSYSYTDADGDAEGSSTYRWLRDGAPIAGAATRTYTLGAGDQGTLIAFEVTPVAATGASPGAAVVSAAVGPVAAAPPPSGSVDVRIATSSDDAEEKATGSVTLTSGDLELVYDGSNQTVGMRFPGINIPQGASITRAWVQFTVDDTSSAATALTIQGEAADNPLTFTTTSRSISTQPRTTSAVAWAPVPWLVKKLAGPDQQTPDLAAVIQEIVSRGGWRSGNALVVIVTGTGMRAAKSYDGLPTGAALLHVEYATP